MNEELDYVSSSPLVGAKRQVVAQDELDLPTLSRVQGLIEEQLRHYTSIASLDPANEVLTVKEQLTVNKHIVQRLGEIKILIDTTIDNVEEMYRDR